MPIEERFHIHICVEDEVLKIERVYADGNKENDHLCSVALTDKGEEGYDPVFGDHAEVVVEVDEARLLPGTDGNVVVVFTI